MTEYLLVDGYNILHSWSVLKEMTMKDLDHARARLLHIMSDYQAVSGVKVVVVFDAHLVKKGTGSRAVVNGVEVIYTAEGETADMVIEKFAGQVGEGDRMTVATSDWAQQRIVFGKGAVRLSARELEEEVKAHRKQNQPYLEMPDARRDLGGRLDDKAREFLERIRRQK
ncbi:NYN domain-containing protein [Phosphitispora fastidiosa]|uniref:NYN domain-containing protein n=1 Tax=Phosphitispora fastidiosa TaxID=2837202 RepID=UPI001E59EE47|nr:NYN domain-containing protein [Phosphitispora fastidiosa]MBU7007482.1 putative RNA-binding protein with PIN domain [Phosphitispora fastidiosa]